MVALLCSPRARGPGRGSRDPLLLVPVPVPAGQLRLLRALLLESSPLPTIPLPFPSVRQALRPVSQPCRLPASFLPAIVALPPAGKRLRPASPAGFPAAGRAGRPRGAAGPRRGGDRWGGRAQDPSRPGPGGHLPQPAPGPPLSPARPRGRGRAAGEGRSPPATCARGWLSPNAPRGAWGRTLLVWCTTVT